MYRIDNSTAATSIPTPGAVGPNPNSFFTGGNPATNTAATVVDADWANAIQEEICNAITGDGITLSKTTRTQLQTVLAARVKTIKHLTPATGTYTPSAGILFALGRAKGGGAGGGGAYNGGGTSNGAAGGGGGEGCTVWFLLTATQLGASQAITIGAGGAGGAYNGTAGAGGTTSIGSLVSAPGGAAGASANGANTGGQGGAGGGAGAVGDLIEYGAPGGYGFMTTTGPIGGNGAGPGGAPGGGQPGGPGAAAAGHNGGGGAGATSGSNGVSESGGAGAAGFVEIWEFIG